MHSETIIGREVFAAIWGLGVLGAAAERINAFDFPFDAKLREFVAAHEKDFSALWQAVKDFSCLSDDVMRIAIEDAPWNGASTKYPDLESLKMELVLSSPTPERFVGTADFQVLKIDHDSICTGSVDNLARLLSALLSAHWAFCSDVRSGNDTCDALVRGLEAIFTRLLPIVGCAVFPSGSLLATAYRAWKTSAIELAVDSDAEGYRTYLEALIAHMDQRAE